MLRGAARAARAAGLAAVARRLHSRSSPPPPSGTPTTRDKAVVSASLNGVLTDPARFNVPVTPEELGQAAYEAHGEGASVVHVHFRDQGAGRGHLPTWEPTVARRIAEEIRRRAPGVLVNFTTGTFGGEAGSSFSGGPLGPTGGPIACLEAGRPEMAALNSGSLNYLKATEAGQWAWKPMLFDNHPDKVSTMMRAMARLNVVPECECFDTGIVRSVAMYQSVGMLPAEQSKVNVSFVMGVASGMPADPAWLPLLVRELEPVRGAQWQVIAIGGPDRVWPLLRAACELGGNVRSGLEDHFYLPDGKRARTSGELVAALVKMLREAGREPASLDEARAMVGATRQA